MRGTWDMGSHVNQSLRSSIGPLYLIGVWYSENQRINTKTCVLNIVRRTYAIN